MTGFGYGFKAGKRRPQEMNSSPLGASLAPSANWDGSAGSGFTQAPTDPVRITAKPAIRPLVVPCQTFTNSLTFGVAAFANDNGTLIGGVDRVRFYFEGATTDVVEPSLQIFTREDGSSYTLLGYWITLRKPSSTSGEAQLYAEAIPADATMQRRVIGPYSFFPEQALHDFSVTIAASQPEVAGSQYQSLNAALSFLKSVSAQCPLVTFTESTTVASPVTAQLYSGGKGWCTITHAPGVTVTFANNSLVNGTVSRFRFRYDRLRFKGSGIVMDFRNIAEFRLETGAPYWLDGVQITNSDPAGNQALFAKGTRPLAYLFSQPSWFTDCTGEHLPNMFGPAAKLVRGCIVEDGYSDLANSAECIAAVTVNGWDSEWWNGGVDAMTLTYDSGAGNGSAASVEQTGGVNSNRTWAFRVDGSVVATFTMLFDWQQLGGNQYNVSDLVSFVNGTLNGIDPGFSASLLDDTRAGKRLGYEPAGGQGKSFPELDITDVIRTFRTDFDIHPDFYQKPSGADIENLVIVQNTIRDWNGQIVFMGATSGDQLRDAYVLNNICDGGTEPYLTQFGPLDASNVVYAHNSWIDQVVTLDSDSFDGYSLFANNIAPSILGIRDNAMVKNNHVEADGLTPTGSIGTTSGGSDANLYVDAVNGDYGPSGALLANPKPAILQFDISGEERAENGPVGANFA